MTSRNETFERGQKLRTEVLGAAHVARSTGGGAFSRPVQDFVTEVGWGLVWGRDGLDRKTRSMVTVAMLAALGEEHELGVHVRGAVNNGVSVHELQEVLLEAGLYGGAPRALVGFRVADEVLRTIEGEGGPMPADWPS